MRLLNASTYELTEFIGDKIPSYAILSHTWGEDEVLFCDIQNKTAQWKKGFGKLAGCCRKAADDGFQWVWIDTCCIDKSSSAELSEAINSMYQWYKNSTVCYAYLEDVMDALPGDDGDLNYFTQSRWFTRGWTLQELIAPRQVEFYTSTWEEIGTKRSLVGQIEMVTEIPARILQGEAVSTCNVAERMSWASKRQTTRREDRAYCLMGLFQINMPLLYGEGDKAFMRLQEQILKQEEDHSIFAWTPGANQLGRSLGCLATSPSQFATVGQVLIGSEFGDNELTRWGIPIELPADDNEYSDRKAYHLMRYNSYKRFRPAKATAIPENPPEVTARGVRLSLPVSSALGPRRLVLAWIYYEVNERLVCVLLQLVAGSARLFRRVSLPWLISVDKSLLSGFKATEVFLHRGDTPKPALLRLPVFGTLRMRLDLSPDAGYSTRVFSMVSTGRWEGDDCYIRNELDSHSVMLIECVDRKGQGISAGFQVSFGILDGSPWCWVDEVSWGEEAHMPMIRRDQNRTFRQLDKLSGRYYELGCRESDPDLGQDSKALMSTVPDRAARSSNNILGMVVSAAMRRGPADWRGISQISQMVLRVGVGDEANCGGWVQRYARQGNKARISDYLMGGEA